MTPSDVTAVLVTRGDQPAFLERIIDSLVFNDVIVWDNSVREDRKTAGRYFALLEASFGAIYFQDDDVLVPRETQHALVDAYMPGVVVANWGHGENHGGYDDLPLVCGGAVLDAELPWLGLDRYLEHFPLDDGFLYEADYVAGVLYADFRHLFLPFDIELAIAQAPERLVNQPWQADLKLKITNQARSVRDMVPA